MLNQPSWFSETYYYEEKMKQMAAAGSTMTLQQLRSEIAEVGGAWAHYEQYGYNETYTTAGVKSYFLLQDSAGNTVLDPETYCKVKLAQLVSLGYPGISAASTWQDVAKIITVDAGMSLYYHYVQYGQLEGLSINSAFSTEAFFKAKLAYIQANAATMPAELTLLTTWQAVAKYYADHDIDSYQNWVEYGVAEGITADAVKPGGGGVVDPGNVNDYINGSTYYLTPTGWAGNVGDGTLGYYYADNLTGTDLNDLFIAPIYNDAYATDKDVNSLGTGDYIDGGAGKDRLEADLTGYGYSSAITPTIKNVEVLKFRMQESSTGTGDNNVQGHIDAERISGAQEFWSSNSRASLKIEDVRINSNLVTVGMQDTDPGSARANVDYKLYFDPQHLKAEDASTSGTLVLNLIDTEGATKGAGSELLSNAYDKVSFHYNGKLYTLNFGVRVGGAMEPVSGTYESKEKAYTELKNAIQAAINEVPELKDVVKVADISANAMFSMNVGNRDIKVSGYSIILKSDSGAFTWDSLTDGWGANGVLPPTTSISATMGGESSTECPLIKTSVALDNVGRVQWDDAYPECLPDNSIYGSRAGDMVIGSMATRGGIERFDVTVDRGSWLNLLSSTNNTLRMITVAAADWNFDTVAEGAQLFIGAYLGTDPVTGVVTDADTMFNWENEARLLTGGKDSAGIWDVKWFIADAYAGNINIYAEFTKEGYAKYLADVDGLRTVDKNYAPSGEFKYAFGSGSDTLNMKVNEEMAADRDFKLVIDTGAGDDLVNFQFGFTSGNYCVDQTALKNVIINTGSGKDTVWAWGDAGAGYVGTGAVRDQAGEYYDGLAGYVQVNAGAGDDAVYTAQDMNVKNAVWVLNANTLDTSITNPLRIHYNPDGQAQPIDNNVASTTSTYTLAGSQGSYTLYGVVEFLGIKVRFQVGTYTVGTGQTAYTVSADEINKAIIGAVQGNTALNNLLSVMDGAGESLLVQSKIDGRYTTADFDVTFYDVTGSTTTNRNGIFNAGDDFVQQAIETDVLFHTKGNRTLDLTTTIGGLVFNGGNTIVSDAGVYKLTVGNQTATYTATGKEVVWEQIANSLNAGINGYTITGDDSLGLGTLHIMRDSTDVVQTYSPSSDPAITYVTNAFAAGTQTGVLDLKLNLNGSFTNTTTTAVDSYTVNILGTNVTFGATGPSYTGNAATDWKAIGDTLQTALNAATVGGSAKWTVKSDTVGVLVVNSVDAVSTATTAGGVATIGTNGATNKLKAATPADIDYNYAAMTGQAVVTVAGWTRDNSKTETYKLTVDVDGNAATTKDQFTLTYTETNVNEAWGTIVAGLNKNLADQLAATTDAALIAALSAYIFSAGTDDGVLVLTSTATNVKSGNMASVTIDYTNSTPLTGDNALVNEWFQNQEIFYYTDSADGTDNHYYGKSEIYGGEGNDVLVTGYADAYVRAGAGNDTIVVGNLTYNTIYGDAGADVIVLGSLNAGSDVIDLWSHDRLDDQLTRLNGYNNVYVMNNGNNSADALAHDAVLMKIGDSGTVATNSNGSFNTTMLDVIHNFDVQKTVVTEEVSYLDAGVTKWYTTQTATLQSDRLYLNSYVNSGSTNPELTHISSTATTIAEGKDNSYTYLTGTYNATTNTFTSGTGNDMLLAYDSNAAANTVSWEAVVLTGVGAGVTVVANDSNSTANGDYFTIVA